MGDASQLDPKSALYGHSATGKPEFYASLAAEHALGLDIYGVNRLACCHEQPVALAASEAEVGAAFGQEDAADQDTVGCEHGDAVMSLAPGKSTPHITLSVAADAVGVTWHGIEEHPAVDESRPVFDHVVDMDGLVPCRRVDHIQPRFIGREAQTVRPLHVADGNADFPAARINSVDTERQLLRRRMAKVIAARPRSVVREPDGIVRFDDDVVRSGESLAPEAFSEDGD